MDPISVVKTAAGVASVRPEHYEGDVELGARLPPANRQGRTALIVRGEAPRFPDALCAAQIHNLSLMSYALTGVHISDGQSIRAAVTHLLRKNRAYHDRVRIRTAAVRQGSVWTLVWQHAGVLDSKLRLKRPRWTKAMESSSRLGLNPSALMRF